MYNSSIFASGIYGVLKVHWVLSCETPLAVRNGKSIFYHTQDERRTKSRGMGVGFEWKQPPRGSDTEHAVAALHYDYRIRNGELEQIHFVPPSSLRGSLRSWTINYLVQPDYRSKMSPPKKDDEVETKAYLENMKEALADSNSGYARIASLFGLAFETRQVEDSLANAGRFSIETKPFENGEPKPISVNGEIEDGLAGPANAQRQMTVRNPLDRMTHASKEGGLHQFLEFSRGETFEVDIAIRNPQPSDLGLLSLWRRELNDGMLRLGALSSIGRGRVSISGERYKLWMGPGAPIFDGAQPIEDGSMDNDALAGLWDGYAIPPDALDRFVTYLQAT